SDLASRGVEAGEHAQRASHVLRLAELLRRLLRRPVRPSGRRGRAPRSPAPMSESEKYESHTHDVLVVGAGGAGLRAAIDAAAHGCSVGLVCKSLLGQAHTV